MVMSVVKVGVLVRGQIALDHPIVIRVVLGPIHTGKAGHLNMTFGSFVAMCAAMGMQWGSQTLLEVLLLLELTIAGLMGAGSVSLISFSLLYLYSSHKLRIVFL